MRCTVLIILSVFFIIQVCSRSSKVRRIIGGVDAVEEEYPYIVRLQHRLILSGAIILITYTHTCTSAVLTPTWSLTAAHCLMMAERHGLTNIHGIQVSVTLTPLIIYGPISNMSSLKILYYVSHPSFVIGLAQVSNDIGLIKSEPIPITKFAKVGGLDYLSMIGNQATLTGYGRTNSTIEQEHVAADATTLMKPLQKLDAVMVRCKDNFVRLNPSICVARRCGIISAACPGDSGGPLLHASGVIGVNSLGPKELLNFCYLIETPPIYDIISVTPVSPFVDWIAYTIHNSDENHKTDNPPR
ncbi:hypothetical protein B5X24_HaOG200413 [Helicoverpa armigera]|nr:hypothetical protein B5X24_HaOG200413 [Helicoverpa armigera]